MQVLIEGGLAKLRHRQDNAELFLDLLISLHEAGIHNSDLHDRMFHVIRACCTFMLPAAWSLQAP